MHLVRNVFLFAAALLGATAETIIPANIYKVFHRSTIGVLPFKKLACDPNPIEGGFQNNPLVRIGKNRHDPRDYCQAIVDIWAGTDHNRQRDAQGIVEDICDLQDPDCSFLATYSVYSKLNGSQTIIWAINEAFTHH